MLGHYLLMAYRNFRKAPFAAVVKILVLSLGLTCFMTAYAVVSYWDHAEEGFRKADRTYALTERIRLRGGRLDTGPVPQLSDPYGELIKRDFPQFETVARASNAGEVPVAAGAHDTRLYAAYADAEFLDVFDLPFVAGDAATAFSRPDSAILTQAAALRLFGTRDAIGRSLRYDGLVDLTVTGVIGPIQEPSHIGDTPSSALRFDILASWDVGDRIAEAVAAPARAASFTYAVLPKGSTLTPQSLAPQFAAFVKRHPVKQDFAEVTYGMMPVRDVVTSSLNVLLFSSTGLALSVSALLLIFGALVLFVACVNYANLAAAEAGRRAKEVGLRKAIGARSGQIGAQCLLETALVTLLAMGAALLAVELLAPFLYRLTGIDITVTLFSGALFWCVLLGAVAAVTLVAGAYPALGLARARPVLALNAGGVMASRRAPAFLVGAQFAVASFLLIAVIVMQQQTSDLRRTGLGTNEDPLLVVTNRSDRTGVDPRTFETAIRALPQVRAVSGMSVAPWSNDISITALEKGPQQGRLQRPAFSDSVDDGFFAAMNIRLLAGRVFDPAWDAPDGGTHPIPIVIDSAFAAQLGYRTPQAAVDQILYMPTDPDHTVPVTVIGVVEGKPLHFAGMGTSASLYFQTAQPQEILIRLSRSDVSGGLAAVRALWERMAPGQDFRYAFEDQLFQEGYATFGSVGQAFAGIALFAFAISIIGLIGMAAHAASRRRHEIGVRKTLGAGTGRILAMLLKDFSKPVLIANLVAWPLAYVAAGAYLNLFLHRIALTPLPFALSLVISLIAAWASIGFQSWRAARVKPAQVLRYE